MAVSSSRSVLARVSSYSLEFWATRGTTGEFEAWGARALGCVCGISHFVPAAQARPQGGAWSHLQSGVGGEEVWVGIVRTVGRVNS